MTEVLPSTDELLDRAYKRGLNEGKKELEAFCDLLIECCESDKQAEEVLKLINIVEDKLGIEV